MFTNDSIFNECGSKLNGKIVKTYGFRFLNQKKNDVSIKANFKANTISNAIDSLFEVNLFMINQSDTEKEYNFFRTFYQKWLMTKTI